MSCSLADVRAEPRRQWLERTRASVCGTGGCQSWYLGKSGSPTLDPSTLSELKVQLAKPDWNDFIERQA